MAIIQVKQCDLCEARDGGDEVEVLTHRVAIDDRAVDLEACGQCWRDTQDHINHIFEEGRPVQKRGPRKKPEPPVQRRGPGRPPKSELTAVKN